MSFFKFKKKKKQGDDGFSMRFDDPGFDNTSSESSKKPHQKKVSTFSDLPQSEFIFKDPGVNDYAERWGAASINGTRFFILAIVSVAAAAYATHYALKAATEHRAQTFLVEVNATTGEYRKPVKMDSITATEGMAKFGLSRWAEWVFTVDPKLSYNYLQDADAMSKGRAKGQFAEYRYKTEIIRHIKEAKRITFAKTLAVDILQPGVAIVNLETKEIDPNGALMETLNYRVRLDYSINPPTEAAVVLRNPIGLEIEGFTYERLVK